MEKILIPYPTPAVYTCPLCHVVFKQALKHLHIAKHVAEKHLGHVSQLVCALCNSEFTNARSAGKHKCGGDSAPHNEVAEVTLRDDSAIYAYPPGPSQCPLCSWASQAKDTAAVTSVEKHMTRVHQVEKPKRRWRCRICNVIADGIRMRTHVCETQGATPHTPPTPSSSPTHPHTHSTPPASATDSLGIPPRPAADTDITNGPRGFS